MKSIKELVMRESKPVYIHTPSKAVARDFLKHAEKEGFLFGDGKRPTKKPLDDYYALHQDLTMNYIGSSIKDVSACVKWKNDIEFVSNYKVNPNRFIIATVYTIARIMVEANRYI